MKGEVEKVWNNETSDGRKYQVLQVNGVRYSLRMGLLLPSGNRAAEAEDMGD